MIRALIHEFVEEIVFIQKISDNKNVVFRCGHCTDNSNSDLFRLLKLTNELLKEKTLAVYFKELTMLLK